VAKYFESIYECEKNIGKWENKQMALGLSYQIHAAPRMLFFSTISTSLQCEENRRTSAMN
jgi:hypothetical protein